MVTVNDYLARRDSEWVGQVHKFLGLEVGLVQQVRGGGRWCVCLCVCLCVCAVRGCVEGVRLCVEGGATAWWWWRRWWWCRWWWR